VREQSFLLVTPREAIFRFSSEDFSPQDRRAAICGLRERGILPIEPLQETGVSAQIVKRFLPGAGILTGRLCGLRQDGNLQSADASDDFFLGVNVKGRSIALQNGQEIGFGDGDAVLLSCAEASFAIVRPTTADFIGIRVPRKAIAPLVHGLDGRMRCIRGEMAILRLLTSYVYAIPDILAESPGASGIVTNHLYDLIALSVGTGHNSTIAFARSVRTARFRAIQSDLASHLDDESLTIANIAERHGVTPRYIHKLFAIEGTTFTHYVLQQRLGRAYRLLRDQRYASRSITSIAYDAGFNDLSYFNRTFRRRYNATPSNVRNEASRK
jgi:AraC-like DNA-binding protein